MSLPYGHVDHRRLAVETGPSQKPARQQRITCGLIARDDGGPRRVGYIERWTILKPDGRNRRRETARQRMRAVHIYRLHRTRRVEVGVAHPCQGVVDRERQRLDGILGGIVEHLARAAR